MTTDDDDDDQKKKETDLTTMAVDFSEQVRLFTLTQVEKALVGMPEALKKVRTLRWLHAREPTEAEIKRAVLAVLKESPPLPIGRLRLRLEVQTDTKHLQLVLNGMLRKKLIANTGHTRRTRYRLPPKS